MLMKGICTSSAHQHTAPVMIPDRCGNVPLRALGTAQVRWRLIAASTLASLRSTGLKGKLVASVR
jgi:hypothetical protein